MKIVTSILWSLTVLAVAGFGYSLHEFSAALMKNGPAMVASVSSATKAVNDAQQNAGKTGEDAGKGVVKGIAQAGAVAAAGPVLGPAIVVARKPIDNAGNKIAKVMGW